MHVYNLSYLRVIRRPIGYSERAPPHQNYFVSTKCWRLVNMDEDWKRVKEELTCVLCQDLLTNPKVLPCLHLFCGGCLQKLSDQLECPLCKTKILSTSNAAEELPSPFYIVRLVEAIRLHEQVVNKEAATPICQNCDDGEEAVSSCSDRCIFLCNFCDKLHKKLRPKRNPNFFG